MGFKKRLVAAFLLLTLVPIFLIALISLYIASFQKDYLRRIAVDEGGEHIMYYALKRAENMDDRFVLPSVQLLVFVALIIILTAVVLVVWLYRSVIRPLNVLKLATNSMKEGNLDFSISGDEEDEIGQLCRDFEEMRIRMKEQIDARMQYERDTVELIGNVSHDLKTPLTAIKGYAEGIMDGVADTEEKRTKYLRTIYTKATDMQALVDELSFFSKIDSNIIPYNFEKLDINGYFEDCVDELSLDTEVKNISLFLESRVAAGCLVVADTEQLRRVVNNIIGNAIKYMDKEEGRITVRLFDDAQFVKVEIEDNGVGIEEKDLVNIFDRFYRADASRNSRKGGTGLGLAIAKKIIEDHGGRIGAVSVPGEGTTMYFTIPKWEENLVYRATGEIEDAEYTAIAQKTKRSNDRERIKRTGNAGKANKKEAGAGERTAEKEFSIFGKKLTEKNDKKQ